MRSRAHILGSKLLPKLQQRRRCPKIDESRGIVNKSREQREREKASVASRVYTAFDSRARGPPCNSWFWPMRGSFGSGQFRGRREFIESTLFSTLARQGWMSFGAKASAGIVIERFNLWYRCRIYLKIHWDFVILEIIRSLVAFFLFLTIYIWREVFYWKCLSAVLYICGSPVKWYNSVNS